MPLRVDARSLSRLGDRPLHRQLADLIRAAIATGDLRRGENLPSEKELAETTGLSRTVIREALTALVDDGLVVKQAGVPTRVATPPPVRHMTTARYADELATLRATVYEGAEHPPTSAFATDHGVDLAAVEVAAEYVEDDATGDDATYLQIAAGDPVLRRQLTKYVHGDPVQLQESVIPLELVKGTPVADPARQPWPGGTIAELHSVGLIVTRVLEEARARNPTGAERQRLNMETPGPVWDMTRVFRAFPPVDVRGDAGTGEERPVEVSTVIVPAARLVLSYETALS